jgi:hypothetical protein
LQLGVKRAVVILLVAVMRIRQKTKKHTMIKSSISSWKTKVDFFFNTPQNSLKQLKRLYKKRFTK